ncbi:unnamed protein product [Peronospora belbahrii]|uniref:GH16 domain-containing protein n=1 Tax=Peronospora belbahrii TaxID=622444 RepID=A0AAU9KTZ3_9STRA|nr:unnamed protein product [Peronospora belbahrii]CAH0516889.1 unnamed protein product [Peronospora belbahrii]
MHSISLWTIGISSWACLPLFIKASSDLTTYPTKSGIPIWVDPDTPKDRYVYTTSRGRKWDLVMSDEFNVEGRNFEPGEDHLWTSVEKPDGVNGALEIYSHNMTSTACDDDGTCYYYIKSMEIDTTIRVYNMYTHPPSFMDFSFYYRAGMVQSWNKFCYQGGMLEVRVQLPGAVSKESGNPDIAAGNSGRVKTGQYYPTWPGIWMMGNLGRAIFSASTNRMWPFSYNECEPDLFDPQNQRISACDDNPGYGLYPNQGRGAPEIDVLEGAGALISSSLQIGPGMPDEYRVMGLNYGIDPADCIYAGRCNTIGANFVGVPTAAYEARGHKSWYQGLRYKANNFCVPDPKLKQDYETIAASVKAGIKENSCRVDTCPASKDVYGDLGLIDGSGSDHWGINSNGTCYPLWNVYLGSYLCDPDNTFYKCAQPRDPNTPKSNAMSSFNYQMDAISSNWPTHVGIYTDYLIYEVEWVTGKNGYVRWNLQGSPLFEVPAKSILDIPQSVNKTNPQKIMVEEPLYIIMNVALSRTWGAAPPNPGKPCRGNGSDEEVNRICDAFPMYLKVDYMRLYQDRGDDLDDDNYMQIGCDPASHPTKEWIEGHIDEYEDNDNKVVEVSGKAFCETSDDCTIGGTLGKGALKTGKCVKKRCECLYQSWGGPRCTTAISGSFSSATGTTSQTYGPPMEVATALAVVACLLSALSVYMAAVKSARQSKVAMAAVDAKQKAAAMETPLTSETNLRGSNLAVSKDNYQQNFV